MAVKLLETRAPRCGCRRWRMNAKILYPTPSHLGSVAVQQHTGLARCSYPGLSRRLDSPVTASHANAVA